MTQTSGYTKRALKVEPGYLVGKPAPLYLDCECGHHLAMPKGFQEDAGLTVCECGRQYDSFGWIVEPPETLMQLAAQCGKIYDTAAKEHADLWGCSVLDLLADNIPEASLADLKSAIIVAGIYPRANDRIKAQIAGYR